MHIFLVVGVCMIGVTVIKDPTLEGGECPIQGTLYLLALTSATAGFASPSIRSIIFMAGINCLTGEQPA